MAEEIERKFLLKNEDWRKSVSSSRQIRQGYLNSNPERTVRVRIIDAEAFITVKSKSKGISRQEFEYEIPSKEAEMLLLLCEKPLIEKIRHEVQYGIHNWEIDVFEGVNKGLTIVEIELSFEKEEFEIPNWLGKEVSNDNRYYNSNLISNPYSSW